MSHTQGPNRRTLLQLLATSAGAWSLSGPITGSAWAQTNGTGKAPELLRIGYQKSAANLVILKQQGALENMQSDELALEAREIYHISVTWQVRAS